VKPSLVLLALLFALGGCSETTSCDGADCDPSATCGNGVREGNEACDGEDHGGASCESSQSGTPVCRSDCTLDLSACCSSDCTEEGASRCNGPQIETCTRRNGCLVWHVSDDCADRGTTCQATASGASCTTTCSHRCPDQAVRCASGKVESCKVGTNGCRDWGVEEDCQASSKSCDESSGTATCVAGCQKQCTEGETRCAGTVVQSCVITGGCEQWTDGSDCADSQQICVKATAASCVEPASFTLIHVHYDTGLGNRVTLRGSQAPLSWTAGTDTSWTVGYVWTLALEHLPGDLRFKPLFNDEKWAPGTDYQVKAGSTIHLYPFFYRTSGKIERWDSFESTALGNSRPVMVYLPPSYDENPLKTYPLFFMHDGQNVFDASTAFGGVEWQIDEAMNALAQTAGIEEAIVVAPYNAGDDRIYEYTAMPDPRYPMGGGADKYLDFLLNELKPAIVQAYRTTGASQRVGIAGSSLGGILTLHACWTRPESFDRCGVFSPSLWWNDEALLKSVTNHTGARPDVKFYVDSGDSGSSNDGMEATARLRDALVAKGYTDANLKYVLGVGDEHNEAAWAKRAPGALEFLLADPQRVPRE